MSGLNHFEELVVVKGALELDFISPEKVKECLDTLYQEYNSGKTENGLLTVLLQKEYLTEAHAEFLREGVEEDRASKTLPKEIDVNDRLAAERFLGMRAADSAAQSKIQTNAKESTRSGTASPAAGSTATNASQTGKTMVVNCPYCQAKYRVKAQVNSNKFKCGKCRQYFFIGDNASTNQSAPAKSPATQDRGSAVPQTTTTANATVHLTQSQVIDMQEAAKIVSNATQATIKTETAAMSLMPPEPPASQITANTGETQAEDFSNALWSSDEAKPAAVPAQAPAPADVNAAPVPALTNEEATGALWSSEQEKESNPVNQVDTQADPASQPLWSSDGNSEANTEKDTAPTGALWSSEQNPAPAESDQASPLWSSDVAASTGNEQAQSGETLNVDFLKLPQNDVNASDILNISVAPATASDAGQKTMELDIRSAQFFKQKRAKPSSDKVAAFIELTKDISQLEATVILKYALVYDFISREEIGELLDKYYQTLSEGKSTESLATMLLAEGFITKFQHTTLVESLDKDKKAKRIPTIDMASRQEVEKFLGIAEDKKMVKITCPHCHASFRVRVSAKGGKFRCGKCSKSFFLSSKDSAGKQ